MRMHRYAFHFPAVVMAIAVAMTASAQNYPVKPIRIVTAQAGGAQDLGARLMAAGITPNLGQQIVVENRSGGTIGGEIVAKAPADGYTLIYSGSIFWTLPLMRKVPPYDVLRDFTPITLATREPLLVVVHPSLPVKSIKDLIALAKARPGQLNYGTGGIGSTNHLSAELFNAMTGVKVIGVQYRGVGAAIIALTAGEVQMMIATSMAPYIKSGRLKAVAITTAKASPLYPGLPPVSATIPGFEASQKAGMFAPAKTPPAIIARLNHELVAFLNKPDIKAKFFADGAEAVGSTPEELGEAVRAEMQRLGKVIKDAGISVE